MYHGLIFQRMCVSIDIARKKTAASIRRHGAGIRRRYYPDLPEPAETKLCDVLTSVPLPFFSEIWNGCANLATVVTSRF